MNQYLRPTAPIAADVLLPADPGLALTLAQELLAKPLMANHHHGLWGYSGVTAGGDDLGVQASGIGGPSVAAVIADLATHGARRVIRVGACVAIDPALAPGSVVLASGALGGDGASRALGIKRPRPDTALVDALARELAPEGAAALVASGDLTPTAEALPDAWRHAGARAADLETAAVLAAGERAGVAAASALVVGGGEEELVELARACARALAPAQAPAPVPADAS